MGPNFFVHFSLFAGPMIRGTFGSKPDCFQILIMELSAANLMKGASNMMEMDIAMYMVKYRGAAQNRMSKVSDTPNSFSNFPKIRLSFGFS